MPHPDSPSCDRPPLAIIAGPTASGKSALAVALAQSHGRAQIINADASQVYSDLAILSARPSETEMGGIAHHLFGHIDGAGAYNAARWASDARAAIAAIHAVGDIPILVGGTGLYLNTLLFGIAPVPEIDPAIRDAVRAMDIVDAYSALAVSDPAAAARLNPADATRIARALEVVQSTGRPLAEWQQAREGGIADRVALAPAILLPPRDWLRERCDRRLVAMFDGGAIDEAEALLARNLDPDLPVMRAIGVPQIAQLLAGEIDRATAIDRAQAATRQYAKRQFTWFRNQPPADWKRFAESLSVDNINEIAILLHEKLLTG